MRVSVVIPVYKKLDMFREYLRCNIPHLGDCEMIIVNDNPTSHLPKDLSDPDLAVQDMIWINNQENLGFSRSINVGTKRASGDLIFLLNSDVKLLDDSWINALSAFTLDPNLFGIGFAQRERDGQIVGRNNLYFKDGLFHHKGLPPIDEFENANSSLLTTAFAEGGSSLFRRSMWEALGGFDEAYSPFYWEDVDLSYRASHRGWKVRFAPHIIVEHHHETNIGAEYSRVQINATGFRNQLYFTDKFARGIQRVEYLFYRYIRLPLQKMKNR